MDQRTKRTLWIVAGAVVFIALGRPPQHHDAGDHHLLRHRAVDHPARGLARLGGQRVRRRHGQAGGPPQPQPARPRRPGRHAHRAGAAVAERASAFFGWAKPVPVNVGRLRSPRNQGVLVSLAGPAINAALAAIFGVVFVQFVRPGVPRHPASSRPVRRSLFYASLVNVGLCVFNLIPIPPLDGSVLFERLLPAR